jgi:hypothetical protein
MFSLLVYSFFQGVDISSSSSTPSVKGITLVTTLKDNYLLYFEYRLEYIYLIIFFHKNLRTKYPNSTLSFDLYFDLIYTTKANTATTLKTLILSIVRSNNSNLNVDSKEYLDLLYSFKEFYSLELENRQKFLYKIMKLIYLESLEIKLFSKEITFKKKKQYDYSSMFSLEKFNKLSTSVYFCSQFPMILKPLS